MGIDGIAKVSMSWFLGCEDDLECSTGGEEGIDMAVRSTSRRKTSTDVAYHVKRRGMVLPFKPLSLAFNHVNYYIHTPIGPFDTFLVGGDMAEIWDIKFNNDADYEVAKVLTDLLDELNIGEYDVGSMLLVDVMTILLARLVQNLLLLSVSV
nr:plant PDR ABC transporter associated [Tanacetum cinerariifolium]